MPTRVEIKRLVPAPGAEQPILLEASDEIKSVTIGDMAFVVWDAALPSGRSFGNLAVCSPEEAQKLLDKDRVYFSRVQWPLGYVAIPGDPVVVPNLSRPEEAGNARELHSLNQGLRAKLLEVTEMIVRA